MSWRKWLLRRDSHVTRPNTEMPLVAKAQYGIENDGDIVLAHELLDTAMDRAEAELARAQDDSANDSRCTIVVLQEYPASLNEYHAAAVVGCMRRREDMYGSLRVVCTVPEVRCVVLTYA